MRPNCLLTSAHTRSRSMSPWRGNHQMAGAVGIEPTTRDFGGRVATLEHAPLFWGNRPFTTSANLLAETIQLQSPPPTLGTHGDFTRAGANRLTPAHTFLHYHYTTMKAFINYHLGNILLYNRNLRPSNFVCNCLDDLIPPT